MHTYSLHLSIIQASPGPSHPGEPQCLPHVTVCSQRAGIASHPSMHPQAGDRGGLCVGTGPLGPTRGSSASEDVGQQPVSSSSCVLSKREHHRPPTAALPQGPFWGHGEDTARLKTREWIYRESSHVSFWVMETCALQVKQVRARRAGYPESGEPRLETLLCPHSVLPRPSALPSLGHSGGQIRGLGRPSQCGGRTDQLHRPWVSSCPK